MFALVFAPQSIDITMFFTLCEQANAKIGKTLATRKKFIENRVRSVRVFKKCSIFNAYRANADFGPYHSVNTIHTVLLTTPFICDTIEKT